MIMGRQRALVFATIALGLTSLPALAEDGGARRAHRPQTVPLAAFGALAGAVTAISTASRTAYYGPYYYGARATDPAPLVTRQASGQF
jgi:hypothetical protein